MTEKFFSLIVFWEEKKKLKMKSILLHIGLMCCQELYVSLHQKQRK